MNPIIRNILAVIVGFVVFGVVNMAIITIGHRIIPPPAGVHVEDFESIKAAIKTFELKHFITPFLAHALAALIGAWLTSLIAASHRFKLSMLVGCLFLIGGILNVLMLMPPVWFIFLDLVVTYLPMSWLGWKLSRKD